MAKTLRSSDINVVRNAAPALSDTGGLDGGDVDDNNVIDSIFFQGDFDNIFP